MVNPKINPPDELDTLVAPPFGVLTVFAPKNSFVKRVGGDEVMVMPALDVLAEEVVVWLVLEVVVETVVVVELEDIADELVVVELAGVELVLVVCVAVEATVIVILFETPAQPFASVAAATTVKLPPFVY